MFMLLGIHGQLNFDVVGMVTKKLQHYLLMHSPHSTPNLRIKVLLDVVVYDVMHDNYVKSL